jgi:hypothetical protein
MLHNSKNTLSTNEQTNINNNIKQDIRKEEEDNIDIKDNKGITTSTINKSELYFTRDNILSQVIFL